MSPRLFFICVSGNWKGKANVTQCV